ncbi:UNKNOWN [Stylonychia lemnae]|uniref:Uncharacterized protein n=1 Tax=Stylonychia lemnae TaxID=5949 RepID=A0A077ZQ81_STYLE|nr:UNKNOWN [Stylonychia lemnae]|eukprot:CDW71545.1 UNKNOWN [Stylonychia lemnae]
MGNHKQGDSKNRSQVSNRKTSSSKVYGFQDETTNIPCSTGISQEEVVSKINILWSKKKEMWQQKQEEILKNKQTKTIDSVQLPDRKTPRIKKNCKNQEETKQSQNVMLSEKSKNNDRYYLENIQKRRASKEYERGQTFRERKRSKSKKDDEQSTSCTSKRDENLFKQISSSKLFREDSTLIEDLKLHFQDEDVQCFDSYMNESQTNNSNLYGLPQMRKSNSMSHFEQYSNNYWDKVQSTVNTSQNLLSHQSQYASTTKMNLRKNQDPKLTPRQILSQYRIASGSGSISRQNKESQATLISSGKSTNKGYMEYRAQLEKQVSDFTCAQLQKLKKKQSSAKLF